MQVDSFEVLQIAALGLYAFLKELAKFGYFTLTKKL